jgi:CheY-like chemotaxis protein
MKELAPNLVLLDIDLPKKGGFEIMEEINKDRNLKKIPIILISNAGQPEEIEKGKKLGAKDFLIKTEFDPQEVLIKVAKQIGNQYG